MNRTALGSKIALLEAISDCELRYPSNIPIPIYLREAEKLLAVGQRDLSALERVGFDKNLLVDLDTRIDVLREAQSLLNSSRGGKGEARRQWNDAAREGCKLHDNLKRALLFINRNVPFKQSLIRKAGKGRTPAAMIQSLNNLVYLARDEKSSLAGINFDMQRLNSVESFIERLGKLLGAADAEKAGQKTVLRLRNAAYTHLYEGLKELRDFGLYLYGDDDLKKLDYTSDYLRAKRLKRKRLAVNAASTNKKEWVSSKNSRLNRAETGQNRREERAAAPEKRADSLRESMSLLKRCINSSKQRMNTSVGGMNSPGVRTNTQGGSMNGPDEPTGLLNNGLNSKKVPSGSPDRR